MKKMTIASKKAYEKSDLVENGQICQQAIAGPVRGWIYIFSVNRSLPIGKQCTNWRAVRGSRLYAQELAENARR